MAEYNRLEQWRKFSALVEDHINAYTLQQYGNDEGNEQIDHFTVDDCWENINRYYNRRKSAVRGEKERLRDPLKVAHYAQFIHDKLMQDSEPDHDERHWALCNAIENVVGHWAWFPDYQFGSIEAIVSSDSIIALSNAYKAFIEERGE